MFVKQLVCIYEEYKGTIDLPSFPVRFCQVHEGGGKRVVGDECGTEAHDGEQAHVVEGPYGAEDEHEEHRAKDEGGHAHGLSDFAVRELERLPVAACATSPNSVR